MLGFLSATLLDALRESEIPEGTQRQIANTRLQVTGRISGIKKAILLPGSTRS